MSLVKRVLTKILPDDWAKGMKTESQNWMLQCTCGYERSYWDIGGIRWKAAGNPKKVMHCPQCGQITQHSIYRRQNSG
jgi:hypothetical protein